MATKRTVTPYEEQLEKRVEELEDLVAQLTGEINPRGQCAYCGADIRFLVRFDTNGAVTFLQCEKCKGPHQMPAAPTLYGYYAHQR